MFHNFRHSLQYERNMASKADEFYRRILKVTDIKRFSTDSEADMQMQRQDVDLTFMRKGIKYKVSEKFREHNFNDLYIELFSKYPHTPGWLLTGSPNAILYFFPSAVYWITHKSLYNFCVDKLFPAIPKHFIDEIYESHKSFMSKTITLDNQEIHIKLVQAHNHDGASWETIGVCVDFDVLVKFGVKFKKFEMNIYE